MSSSRNGWLAMLGLACFLALASWWIIVPNYRQAAAIDRQMNDIKAKIAGFSTQTSALQKLTEQVDAARKRVQTDLKSIPENPDIAGLIRKFSQVVDRVRVLDQTFNAGSPNQALSGGKSSVQAMPLTVDMEATFDSVFALIQNVESINRLVRVASVRIVCKRDEKDIPLAFQGEESATPIVKASVGLEAIYDTPLDLSAEELD